MKKNFKFNFNPFRKGLDQVLGPLEKEILDVLWERGELCVKDMHDILLLKKTISYSTVITVSNRMVKKGLLKKRKIGKAYFYKTTYPKEQFIEIISEAVVKGVSEFSPSSAIAHFADSMVQMEPDKIEYFSQLIESKRKKLNKKPN